MAEQRELRPRAQYNYHDMISCDELLDKFSIRDKLKEPRYAVQQQDGARLAQHLPDGRGLTVKTLQSQGFTHPIIIHKSTGLGLRMPPATFSVDDVRRLIGPQRKVDAMNCDTQQAVSMSLDQFCSYYGQSQSSSKQSSSSGRRGTLNVISLEFSHTPLDPLVEPPSLVSELDWVSTVWPTDLIKKQSDPTNDIRKMMYPKVRKYCLMSVAGCYTDFHVDFGGTSVWYHIIKGEKIFILIPPSLRNYDLFVRWHSETFQEAIFFADEVDECEVVRLKAGDTLLMPSGWIHAVYTPKDSLVFGGNFLNCFNIGRQLEVAMLEDKLKVKSKFRFPLYSHIHWYLVNELLELLNSLETHVVKSTTQEVALPPYHTWLKAVTVKKLSHKDYRKLGFKEKENKRKDRKQRIVKGISSSNFCLPHLTQTEKDGFLLLVKKMREEKLFSEDVPSRIYHPGLLLERLETRLTSAQLPMLFCKEINGVTILHHIVAVHHQSSSFPTIPSSSPLPCSTACLTPLETDKGNIAEHNSTTLSSINVPSSSLPETIQQPLLPSVTIIQPSLPATIEQSSLPATIEQSSLPATNEQPSLPATNEQPSLPATIEQPSLPVTVEQPSLPATIEQPSLPATNEQPSLPVTVEQPSLPATNEQPSLPATIEQPSLPVTVEQPSLPATIEQPLLPATIEQPSLPATIEQPSLPVTVEQPSLPATIEQPLLPATIEQPSLPATIEQPSLPATIEQPSLPATNEQPSLPATNEQPSLPATIEQPSLPATNEQPSLPATIEQLLLSATNEQPSLPATIEQLLLSATNEQPSLPATIEQPSLPATIEQPSLPVPATNEQLAIIEQTSLPATVEQPLSLPETVEQPLSLPATIEHPLSLPATNEQPLSATTTTTSTVFTSYYSETPLHSKALPSHSHKKIKRAQSSRRKRCGVCEGCTRSPCGCCKFCLDSPQRGGEGKLKQACLHRKCTALMAPLSPSSFTCERRPADSTTADHPDTLSPTLPESFTFTVPVPTTAGGEDKKAPLHISLFDTFEREKLEKDKRKESDLLPAYHLESPFVARPLTQLIVPSPPTSQDHTEIDLPSAKRSRTDHEDVMCSGLKSDPLLSSINSLPPNTLQLLSSISLASLLPISLSSQYSSPVGGGDFVLQLPEEEQPLPSLSSQSSLLDEMVSATEQMNSDSV